MLRFYLALWASKLVNLGIRLLAPQRGSNYAGLVALKIDPQFVHHVKGKNPSKTLFITGTNGKSTTNNLIYHILSKNNVPVVSNIEGANMLPGIARMLLNTCSMTGRAKDAWYICETDERSISNIVPQMKPGYFLAVNITEDQVQRNSDPGFIMDLVREALPEGLHMILNADEPKSRTFGDLAKRVTTFGVTEYHNSYPPANDNVHTPCPHCYHPLDFTYFNNQGQGRYTCHNCGYANAGEADYYITELDAASNSFVLNGDRYPMPLDLPYMVYNEAAAIAVARELVGLEPRAIASALESYTNIAGRYEVFNRGSKTLKSLRIKQENPETLQNVINVISSDPNPKIVVFALLPVEDFKPWYMNVAYLLSCNVDRMLQTPIDRLYHIGDAVSHDSHRFFHYLGVDEATNVLLPDSRVETLLSALDRETCDNIYIIPSVNFYTELVDQVQKGGLTSPCPERLRKY